MRDYFTNKTNCLQIMVLIMVIELSGVQFGLNSNAHGESSLSNR
jgi:hypothetical protein